MKYFVHSKRLSNKRNAENDFLSFAILYIKGDNRFAESNLRGSYIRQISWGYFYSKILAWIVDSEQPIVFSVVMIGHIL